MPLFWKPYTSDITSLIDQLKADKPSLEEEQRLGRAIWWDRKLDREALVQYDDASVPQQPYVYQTSTK